MIKFSVNHWSTEYFPAEEPFYTWMDDMHYDEYLLNQQFVKDNKLVVVYAYVDMSLSFAVCAPEEFVEKFCPCVLCNEKNKKFVFDKDADEGLLLIRFKDYSEENIGIWYYDNHEDTFHKTWTDANGQFHFAEE